MIVNRMVLVYQSRGTAVISDKDSLHEPLRSGLYISFSYPFPTLHPDRNVVRGIEENTRKEAWTQQEQKFSKREGCMLSRMMLVINHNIRSSGCRPAKNRSIDLTFGKGSWMNTFPSPPPTNTRNEEQEEGAEKRATGCGSSWGRKQTL
jgi:hypothetical protein